MTKRVTVVASIWGVLVTLANAASGNDVPVPEPTTTPATATIEQIRHGLKARFSGLHDLAMYCELREDVINGRKPGEIPQGSPLEQIIGDKKLGYPWMIAEHRYDGERIYRKVTYPRRGAESRQETLEESWDGVRGYRLDHYARTGSIIGYRSSGVQRNQLLDNLFWPCVDEDLKSTQSLYLPSSVDTPDARVRRTCEIVLGSLCHVVEVPDLDEVWVDVDRNFAVVMRRRRFDRGGPLRVLAVNSDWENPSDNLWLPRSCVVAYYCGPERAATMHNTVSSRVTIQSRFERPALSSADFGVDFPSGTLLHDATRNRFIQVGATLEESIESVELTDALLSTPNPPPSSSSMWRFLFLLGNLVLLIVALLIWWRWRRTTAH